ncbi:hydroxymethylbilane synthase [Flexistipes sp.]|uniref:hydroxymethylbilane synthase n=1 Tax=Flexistipes sp. TaxID=3088135 RepID=UPI002E1E13FD|nr:hydroxymethylbilane synthase [Flexistipes sp.]
MKKLTIATRSSQLAVWQADFIKNEINKKYPDVTIELKKIKTKGDKILDTPLAKIGGKGLFVKEVENALYEKEADIAVHSMKDVPSEMPEGMELYVTPKRETPFDAFLSINYNSIDELPNGAVVGTSSLRRMVQIRKRRPDLQIENLRGNINTRIKKLEDGMYDAIVLAKAGLVRVGFFQHLKQTLTEDIMIPAVCQGTLGIEVREDDMESKELLKFFYDEETYIRTKAERAFLKTLEGGCQVPIAGYSILNGSKLKLMGMVSSLDAKEYIYREVEDSVENAESMGISLAKEILNAGGREILANIYHEE